MPEPIDWNGVIATIYQRDRGRVLATLIRLLGSFDLAEEALQDAFSAALQQWPERGVPETPWRWLVSAGRFRTIDRLRRQARFDAAKGELARTLQGAAEEQREASEMAGNAEDDRLRLIFTCCNPVLAPDAQIALTLREICGLTTEAIAAAFLTTAPTLAQRIVRAKAKIRSAAIPYAVPPDAELPERLESVLRTLYLIFNEGYAVLLGETPFRSALVEQATALARQLAELLPDPEVLGLLALMLLQDSRRRARFDSTGNIVLLGEQNRRLWDVEKIVEARSLIARAYAQGEIGSYVLQAAIALEHARAPSESETDWAKIISLYDQLRLADPSPIVELNRAAAIGMRDGPRAGIALIDVVMLDDVLASYRYAHAARAELLRRAGRSAEALAAYRRALDLTAPEPERRFLSQRIALLQGAQEAASSAEISSTSDS